MSNPKPETFRERLVADLHDYSDWSWKDTQRLVEKAVRLHEADMQAKEEASNALFRTVEDRLLAEQQGLMDELEQVKKRIKEADEELSEVILEAVHSGYTAGLRSLCAVRRICRVVRGLIDQGNTAEREAADLRAEVERLTRERDDYYARKCQAENGREVAEGYSRRAGDALADLRKKLAALETERDKWAQYAADKDHLLDDLTWSMNQREELREKLKALEEENRELHEGFSDQNVRWGKTIERAEKAEKALRDSTALLDEWIRLANHQTITTRHHVDRNRDQVLTNRSLLSDSSQPSSAASYRCLALPLPGEHHEP